MFEDHKILNPKCANYSSSNTDIHSNAHDNLGESKTSNCSKEELVQTGKQKQPVNNQHFRNAGECNKYV